MSLQCIEDTCAFRGKPDGPGDSLLVGITRRLDLFRNAGLSRAKATQHNGALAR